MDLISSLLAALNEKAEPLIVKYELIPLLKDFLNVRDPCIR